MLDEHGIDYRYREYTEQPLSADEIRGVLDRLDLAPRAVLRKNDKAYRELGLSGGIADDRLIELMAEHPTLLQRPIGVLGDQAIVGRPAERLLELTLVGLE